MIRLIYEIEEFYKPRPQETSANWTVVIPAAGRATRLQSNEPKIIYPVLGKPILDWLTDLLKPLFLNFVFVLTPEGAPAVVPQVRAKLGERATWVTQENPLGMADAVLKAEEPISTPYTAVMWGDQITPRHQTLAACMTLLEMSPNIQATIPTIQREDPYIHFIRDEQDRITGVFQKRESDQVMAAGESDCGAFFFRTEALFRTLHETRQNPDYLGVKTGEWNFLSLLPLFNNEQGFLATVRIKDPTESVGINTPEDAAMVARILRDRES